VRLLDRPRVRTPRHRDRATWVVVAVFALLVLWRVLGPPVVGAADNGDYSRLLKWFQLAPVSTRTSPATATGAWIGLHYRVDHHVERDRSTLSSEVPVIALALGMSRAVGRHVFDLRVLGIVNALLLVAAFATVLLGTRPLGRLRWVVAVGVLLVFADVSYVQYLNSFYSETASLIGGVGLTGAALWAVLTDGPRLRPLALMTVFGVGFVFAKPQNGLLGIPLALFVLAVGLATRDRRARLPVIGMFIVLVVTGFLSFALRPAETSRANLYNAVFFDLLKHSPNPGRDAKDLGLDPALARYAGTNAFEPGNPIPDPAFRRAFFDHTSYGKLARFFARHPSRFEALVSRSSRHAFELRPEAIGNFTYSKHRKPWARSNTFAWWTHFQDWLPGSIAAVCLAFLVQLAVAATTLRRGDRRMRGVAVVVLLLLILAGLELLVIVFGEGEYELVKHLFEYHVLFDMATVLTVTLAVGLVAGYVPTWRDRRAARQSRANVKS
jgi:hypothetical protein